MGSVEDRKLPALRRAEDDGAMLGRLRAVARLDAVVGVRHRVVKHKPGKHCVIEYRLDGAGGEVRTVFGKLYRDGRGETIFAHLSALWARSRGGEGEPARLGMPEPLGYLPDLGMVLLGAVPGTPLVDVHDRLELLAAMGGVARNLRVLHGLAVDAPVRATMEEHVRRYCRPGPEVLIAECPDLARLVEEVLAGLRECDRLEEAPVCPVHGDLGLSQVFVAADGVHFIDFDGLCLSHAALDAANFVTALEVRLGGRGRELARSFLDAYLGGCSPAALPGFRAYRAFIHFRRAMIAFRQKVEVDWSRKVRGLLERARGILREGEGLLP